MKCQKSKTTKKVVCSVDVTEIQTVVLSHLCVIITASSICVVFKSTLLQSSIIVSILCKVQRSALPVNPLNQ